MRRRWIFWEDLGTELYKVASFELTDLPLIRRIAATGKPVIMSTGMADLAEIKAAVAEARTGGCPHIVLLKCTSTYPASPLDSNLLTLPDLRARTGCLVGLSDHTLGIGCSVASVALGASVIERHLTLDRNEGGVDADFSLEPREFRQLADATLAAWQGLGQVTYGGSRSEQASRRYRRSIYVSRDIKSGELLSPDNVRVIRPGFRPRPRTP